MLEFCKKMLLSLEKILSLDFLEFSENRWKKAFTIAWIWAFSTPAQSHTALMTITLENCTPLTEFPRESRGGDQIPIPMTLGITRTRAPETPDLAGRPTLKANCRGLFRSDHLFISISVDIFSVRKERCFAWDASSVDLMIGDHFITSPPKSSERPEICHYWKWYGIMGVTSRL